MQAFQRPQQFARRAIHRKLLQHVRQLPTPQPVLQFGFALTAQQLFQPGVGAALGDECQGFAVRAGDFEMLGQSLMQRHFTALIDAHGGFAAQPGQIEQFADQLRAVARVNAQGVSGLVTQVRIPQIEGEHAGFLVRALAVQVQVGQQA
ncbi:hypothetical protein D3C81_1085950 [compost metagenome]